MSMSRQKSIWPLHPAAIWAQPSAPPRHPARARQPRRWRLPATVAGVGVLAVLAADQAFGVTLTETYFDIDVRSVYQDDQNTVLSDGDELTISGGTVDEDTKVSKLMLTNFATQYPREPNNVQDNYISAEIDGNGDYGLGASGIVFSPSTRIAEATYARTYRNDGTTPEPLEIGFTIPRLETSIGGYASQQDLSARSSAFAFYEVRDANDKVVDEGDLFDFWLEIEKAPVGPSGTFDAAWQWSDDLDAMIKSITGLTFEDESYGSLSTTSLSVAPFSSRILFETLDPGETVTFMLVGEARLAVGPDGVEGGGQALVGDPFDIFSPEGLPVFSATVARNTVPGQPSPNPSPAPVPVPAAAWLLVTALVPLFALRRSARARMASA